MAIVSNTVMPPSEWPKVTLGGRTYTVKYSMLANYELSKASVNYQDALSILTDTSDPRNFSRSMDLWRACTAHEFKHANPPQIIPTTEYWIEILENEQDMVETFKAVTQAIKIAILKWSAGRRAAVAPAETAAAPTPENPTPPQVQ